MKSTRANREPIASSSNPPFLAATAAVASLSDYPTCVPDVFTYLGISGPCDEIATPVPLVSTLSADSHVDGSEVQLNPESSGTVNEVAGYYRRLLK